MSNGAKVIDNRVLRNGLGDKVRQTVIQYADGSQVVVSTVLPGGRIGAETLVFLAEGGDISDFSEIAGGRGAGRHDIEVKSALKFESAAALAAGDGAEEVDLFDTLSDIAAILGLSGLEDEDAEIEFVEVADGEASA